MSPPERPGGAPQPQPPPPPPPAPAPAEPAAKPPDMPGVPGSPGSRYGWFVGLLALLIIAYITVNTVTTHHNGATGVPPGQRMPPFAVPLALGTLNGDADIATAPHQGSSGNRAACTVRGPQILNVCQLYERGPVVLALFVARSSCPAVLDDIQRLAPAFPGVQFAAVESGGDRAKLRSLIRSRGWTFPVGYSHDAAVANIYGVASCPQLNFAYPGGQVAQKALLARPAAGVLRARVRALVAGAQARGWKPPAR